MEWFEIVLETTQRVCVCVCVCMLDLIQIVTVVCYCMLACSILLSVFSSEII